MSYLSRKTVVIREYKPYIDLAGAILRQAKEDYLEALRIEDYEEQDVLEAFFRGWYGQLLSFNQGEYIIGWCKGAIAEEKRQRRKHETYGI